MTTDGLVNDPFTSSPHQLQFLQTAAFLEQYCKALFKINLKVKQTLI